MAKSGSQGFASTINKWKMMIAGYEKHSADMAFAADKYEKLKTILKQSEDLNVKQEQLKKDLAKATEELNAGIKEGKGIYASLMRFVKGQYGPSSVEIKDFKPTGEK